MPKKELPTHIRTMQLFKPLPSGVPPRTDAEDKDETIRQLRASLEVLQARDAKRLQAAREGMRKKREKPKT
jgi:hypothetical protein